MRIKFTHIAIVLLMLICGCGIFKSTKKVDSSFDSTAVRNKTITLSEYESLAANIPASYIASITTASGMKINLRDTLVSYPVTSQKRNSESQIKNIENKPVDSGSISISYNREKKKRDSLTTETHKEQTESAITETEIETSWPWLTWVMFGTVVALILVIVTYLLLNKFVRK